MYIDNKKLPVKLSKYVAKLNRFLHWISYQHRQLILSQLKFHTGTTVLITRLGRLVDLAD